MARYTGPVCRLCRREGTKLFLKGDRCTSDKCAYEHRPAAPGPHTNTRKKTGEYGIQLREKQKARRYYGVLESQFKKYYEMARLKPGKTGENLLIILESRLDNVAYKMGLGASRSEARQMVRHGHFTLNGRRADIPSILVKPGDVIAVKEGSRSGKRIKELAQTLPNANLPKWLEMDAGNLVAKVIAPPTRDDVDFPFVEQLIVELYSK